MHLTIDAFTRVLSEAAFHDLDAGIALQAYLPDSNAALERVAAFARNVTAEDHGSIVKVRLVKGANLAMEHVESQLRGWPQAPFTSKAGVDANFKRLLDCAIDPLNRDSLRVGVTSHNLFDVGWPRRPGSDRRTDRDGNASRGWPTHKRSLPPGWRGKSYFTRLSCGVMILRLPSLTSCGASMRTHRLRIFWPTCST